MLLIILILFSIYLLTRKGEPNPQPSNFLVTRSDNGYNGHLDFLEMHGFISEEEREAQREFERQMDSGEYKAVSLEEYMKTFNIKSDW
jgi:hypothetical protein